jgi:hypothetical protein
MGTEITTKLAIEINTLNSAIESTLGQALHYAAQIGIKLNEVKAALPHGEFGRWLEGNIKREDLERLIVAKFIKSAETHDFKDTLFDSLVLNKSVIRGAKGQRRTRHEILFGALFPEMQHQVSFGTGSGGYKKYISKSFVADFYDESSMTIFEIDGDSHNTEIQKIKDFIRTSFFKSLGIEVVRISNESVERLIKERVKILSIQSLINAI